MSRICEICCLTFRDFKDLSRHYSSKKHIEMLKKKNNNQDEIEEIEEMADPRLIDKDTLDLIIYNSDAYERISKDVMEKRNKIASRFNFLHDLFKDTKEIDYSIYNESQKEYYSEHYNHPDLLRDKYPHLNYSSQELKDMLDEKEELIDQCLKINREYEREKPRWYQMCLNELISNYKTQERELEKRAFKELKMKQLLESMAMKK